MRAYFQSYLLNDIMHIIIVDDYQKLSQKAAKMFLNQLAINPTSVFGLPTGATPLGMYDIIIKAYQKYGYDFSKVKTFNLDEYVGLEAGHKQSYHFFMYDNFFNFININKNNIYIPDGCATDLKKHCSAYENLIKRNPVDLQILGLGANGHIGFNEPGSSVNSRTRVVELSEQTLKDNACFFGKATLVPKQAITMGIATIMSAKKILVLASGKHKAEAVRQMINGEINAQCPASFLRQHPDVYVIIDKDAATYLKKFKKETNGWSDILVLNKNILPSKKKVVIISPHHDDSAVSCGATIKALTKHNQVYTLVMTEGYHAAMPGLTKVQKIKISNQEAVAESKILGSKNMCGHFKFYDHGKKYWEQDLMRLTKILKKMKPHIIILPHKNDEHPTHALSAKLITDYLREQSVKNLELWFYEGLWSQHLFLDINLIFGFDQKLLSIKNKALAQHHSQTMRLPLARASQALATFRATTLPEQRFVSFGQKTPVLASYVEAYDRVKL